MTDMAMPGNPDEADDAMGVEPEEESGAGYGNHAPEPGGEPSEDDAED